MSDRLPEVTADHVTVDDGDILLFTVKNGLSKIGVCQMDFATGNAYCLYSHDEPVLTFSEDGASDYSDKTFTERGSVAASSTIAKVIDEAFDSLRGGSAPEYALPQVLRLLGDGLYAVSYLKAYPTTGENMFFWSGYGVPKQLKYSSRYVKLIAEDKNYSAPFLIASHRPTQYDPSLVKKASQTSKRGNDLFGISLHISGLYSLLLKGHHAAAAAVIEDEPFYTFQIQRISDIWKIKDEDGRQTAVGFSSASFKIPFSALGRDQIRTVLAARKYPVPETYRVLKSKLCVVKNSNAKSIPNQLNTFAETCPDADMVASAQGIGELTKPMLDALLAGSTTLDDKVIISDNYYASITAACNYLRYHSTDDFINFALSVMRNPELSATYSYVAGCLVKYTDKRIKTFFEEVLASNDAGYDKIMAVAKRYIDNYDNHQTVSREDYLKSLPDYVPKKKEKIISLDSTKEMISEGGGAELIAKHISHFMKEDNGEKK